MKLSTRYGDMFSCGWLPPTCTTQAGFMLVFGVELYKFAPGAHKFPPADGEVGGVVEEATGTWLCAGISEMLSV